jgi:hypothetical protein
MAGIVVWSEASPSVLHFARNLIHNFHPHLQDARIAFVFRSEAQKQGARLILGQACKVPAKMQPFLEYDFLIWISEEDYMKMDDIQREAIIDHELCHCTLGIDGWKMRPHDIQEFTAVIERHGIYSMDVCRVEKAIETYKQSGLPGSETIEISALGQVVTLTGAQLDRAARAIGG